MKKFWNFLATLFGFGEKALLDQGGQLFEQALENFYTKNPKLCEQLVASLYPFIDVALEDAAEKTKTTYDDDAVAEVKKELEAFATKHGFTLTNLDAGQPGD